MEQNNLEVSYDVLFGLGMTMLVDFLKWVSQ